MTAGWVAPVVRGSALVRRQLGVEGARSLASATSWPAGRKLLASTYYGTELAPDADRAEARWAATGAAMWQLRVLAGWLPPASSRLARLFAGPVEIGNIAGHLAALQDDRPSRPVAMGSLGTVWPAVANASSDEQVRSRLTRSTWGDPGGGEMTTVVFGLQVSWLRRLLGAVRPANEIALGGLCVLLTREQFVFERPIADITGRMIDGLVGVHWRSATSIDELARSLPAPATWPLESVSAPGDVWRAEVEWLHRANDLARRLARPPRRGRDTAAAVMALLLIDLWLVQAAIEMVGRDPSSVEVFDAVA